MNVWLLQANEPMPVVNDGQRLFRMGLIAQELVKRGHNVTWFATTFNHFEKKQMYNKDMDIEVRRNYEIRLIWAPSYKKNISIKRIINHKYMAIKFRKMANKMQKPDLIYSSFPTIEFAEEAVKYGKKYNIPVILDIRDLWPDIFSHNISKAKQIVAWPYIKIMELKTNKIMKQAYAINGISDKVVEWGLEKARRSKTANARRSLMGYEKNHQKELKEINEINLTKFNLCFFGTLGNQFQFDKLIEIAKLLKNEDVNIYICGLGPNYDYLKEKSRECENIKMLGWLSKDKLQYVLNNSKIGIANYKPTFDFKMAASNKFAEYLSYGLPIILTSGGFMGELIEEYNCGINSEDCKKIAKFIIDIKNNNDEYTQISKNAIKLYEEKFNAQEVYTQLVNYLEEIENRYNRQNMVDK